MEEKCFNCKFFESDDGGYFRSEYSDGDCWLNPPTVIPVLSIEKQYMQVRPKVSPNNFCGYFVEKIED